MDLRLSLCESDCLTAGIHRRAGGLSSPPLVPASDRFPPLCTASESGSYGSGVVLSEMGDRGVEPRRKRCRRSMLSLTSVSQRWLRATQFPLPCDGTRHILRPICIWPFEKAHGEWTRWGSNPPPQRCERRVQPYTPLARILRGGFEPPPGAYDPGVSPANSEAFVGDPSRWDPGYNQSGREPDDQAQSGIEPDIFLRFAGGAPAH